MRQGVPPSTGPAAKREKPIMENDPAAWLKGARATLTRNLALAAVACIGMLAVSVQANPGGTIAGRASVIDGDTIEIRGERIRFSGIDAPESSQLCFDATDRRYRCGAWSARLLAKFLAESSPTTCEIVERDRYGRFVGNCHRSDGVGAQDWLVFNGLALDWPRYSEGKYAALQNEVKANRRGIWSGSFEPPWEWRAKKRSP